MSSLIRAHHSAEPAQRRVHHLGIELLAIAGHEHVAGLVDEAHGIERAGMDGLLGMFVGLAHLVHALRKLAARRHVVQNHVAVEGKQRLRESVALSCLARYVEFHHQRPCSILLLPPIPSAAGNTVRLQGTTWGRNGWPYCRGGVSGCKKRALKGFRLSSPSDAAAEGRDGRGTRLATIPEIRCYGATRWCSRLQQRPGSAAG